MHSLPAVEGPLFLKGHGTENDFVVLVDDGATLRLTEEVVRRIADRRRGLGCDGVLRIARGGQLLAAEELAELPADCAAEDWFMDYRNADGSIAEMCGNGVRVFAHALVATGLAQPGTIRIGTRAGLRPARVHDADQRHARVSVNMGRPEVLGVSQAAFGGRWFAGLAVDVGNPHLAAIVPGLSPNRLAELPVDQEPEFDTDFFPAGVNIEVATELRDGQVHMRVHERGAGETRSCGTGIVATAVAALADVGQESGAVRVHVPGGVVEVVLDDGVAEMTGPSRIIAAGQIDAEMLAPSGA